MKLALLGILLILLPLNIPLAQGWHLVHPEYRNAYYEDDGELVAAGMYIDSVRFDVITGEQIFHLNTVVRQEGECSGADGCTFLRNQEQFLGLNYRAVDNGWQTLRKDGSHRIFRYDLGVGEDWIFNESDGTSAIILSRSEQEILPGLVDSVMTFATSAADTIRWAKIYGIVEFRSGEDETIYRLSGIKELEIGDTGLGFSRIFDFSPGDRFYYNSSAGGFSSTRYTLTSIEILNKSETDSSYVYDVHRLSYTYWIDMLFPPPPDVYLDTFETVTYLLGNYPALESFPHELVLNPHDLVELSDGFLDGSFATYQRSDLELLENTEETRIVGRLDENWEGSSFQIIDHQDELETNTGLEAYQQSFAAGRGELSLSTIIYADVELYREQVGSIINGDTTGLVFPDSILTVSTRDQQLVTLPLWVFPNPTQDWLYLQPPAGLNRQNTEMFIQDGLGRTLLTQRLNENDVIDVSQLGPGWYSTTLISNGKRYLARWLKH
ncbi:hypothetical protein CEQ90_04565 [Lewinellaceae bacterium SD302]|nr:hypothetical protein CEQ90_04565 [Lewinellaceae bacterium SD302]